MKKVLKETKAAFDEHRLAFDFTIETIRAAPTIVQKNKNKSKQIQENWFPGINAVFVHIPKTAGTTTHSLLSEAEHASAKSRLPDAGTKTPNKHATALDWQRALGEEAWQSLFSFCFVRNPWDLMVSSYLWWCQHATKFKSRRRAALQIRKKSFDHFIHSDYGRFYLNEIHGPSLSAWYSDGARDLVDYIGRFETYESDMRHILDRLGVEHGKLPIKQENSTARSAYRDYYSQSGRDIVANRFADIIKRFDYKF
ncbi:sulfotransferase family 2 domain-containing protein [Salinisphaera sp. USBA-960]|nr:sulfotransferase family 2 domain-containing protein [Salifodinibacter halophilus]NNC26578.1 sulfotransferase family 2 domain-containing protein [Salifodinibacter halophilus]